MDLSDSTNWIRTKRTKGDKFFSLNEIKDQLKVQYHYTQRQVNWAIELYLDDLEEANLAKFINDSTPQDGIVNVMNAEFNHATHAGYDCTLIWFDKYVRVKLMQQLLNHKVTNGQIKHIYLNICDFSEDQLNMVENDSDTYVDFSGNYPVWLSAGKTASEGWNNGLKLGKEKICQEFKNPIRDYLLKYYRDDIVKEICDKGFYFPTGE